MWLLLTDAAFSVVQHENDADKVLVRSREADGLLRWFPGEQVVSLPGADYPHRIIISREQLKMFLAHAADQLDYPNFKDAVADPHRHDWYMQVYSAWLRAHR